MISLRSYNTPLHTTTLRGYQLKILDDVRSSKLSLHIVPRQIGSTTTWWYYASLLYNNAIPFKILTANTNMVRDYIYRFNTDSIYDIERVPINQCRTCIDAYSNVRPGYIGINGVVLIDNIHPAMYSTSIEQIAMIIKESLLRGNNVHMIHPDDQPIDNRLSELCDIFRYQP